MQGVLPRPDVRERVARLSVGFAHHCDRPEADFQQYIQKQMVGAGSLPWFGFMTHDMQWVAGGSGKKGVDGFLDILAQVEKSPLVDASPAAAKSLEALCASADKAAAKSDWKGVFAAGRSAAELYGRSPFRDRIAASVAKARAWADGEMTSALAGVKSGGDRNAVRAALRKVSAACAGEPEQKEADVGLKAVDKLGVVEGLAAEQQAAARERAAKDFAGTRWTALFVDAAPETK